LLPIAVELPAFAAPGEPLPSATFEFGKLPVEERDHAEIRSIVKGKLVTNPSKCMSRRCLRMGFRTLLITTHIPRCG